MDILGRLREYETWSEDWPIIKEAADEIERLREAIQKISDGIYIAKYYADEAIKKTDAALQQKDSG